MTRGNSLQQIPWRYFLVHKHGGGSIAGYYTNVHISGPVSMERIQESASVDYNNKLSSHSHSRSTSHHQYYNDLFVSLPLKVNLCVWRRILSSDNQLGSDGTLWDTSATASPTVCKFARRAATRAHQHDGLRRAKTYWKHDSPEIEPLFH